MTAEAIRDEAEAESLRSELEMLAESPAARRELSLEAIVFFDSYYCGMRWAPHREEWLETIIDAFARARESLESGDPRKIKLLMLAPRGHGKTEAAITVATLIVCFWREVRILLIGASADTAKKRLQRIKTLLQSEAITEDWTTAPEEGFGPFLPPNPNNDDRVTWGAEQIKVLRADSSVDLTIEAVGCGKKITGGHFDLIILDDPEDYDSVKTSTGRAYTKTWMRSTVLPMLNQGGLMLMIGTRKHHDDLYGWALKDPTWEVIEDVAIQKWPEHFEPVWGTDHLGRDIVIDWIIEGDSEVLWSEQPIKLLLTEREGMTPTDFEREYQNNVVDEDTVLFKMTWLEAACDRGRKLDFVTGPWPDGLLVVQGWDPSFVVDAKKAADTDSDYMVGITLAAHIKTRDRYLLGMSRDRGGTPTAKAGAVRREYAKWAPPADALGRTLIDAVVNRWCVAAGMETNNGGEFLRVAAIQLESGSAAVDSEIPLVKHWTGVQVNDAFAGVPSLGAQFETGRIIIPHRSPQTRTTAATIVTEFHEMGFGAHDDIVLAWWIAECLLRRVLGAFDAYLRHRGLTVLDVLAMCEDRHQAAAA